MPDSLNKPYRAGFVAIIGRPNVGKSTLINRMVGQKIAAISRKPQTTRRQQLGILTSDSWQLILIDTPGLHSPHHLLGEQMNKEAIRSLEGCDLILALVDASVPPHDEDELVANQIKSMKRSVPILIALNKIDIVNEGIRSEKENQYQTLIPGAEMIQISALNGFHLDTLIEKMVSLLPESLPFYPDDQLTDIYERDIAADLIREAALEHLHDEIPHSLAIRIDEFVERGDRGAYIAATLFVERESQKPIVIGQGGKMLKEIGTSARREIEAMSGRKVFLKLRVKTRPNWRSDKNALRSFGFGSSGI
jgi:GTPase